jgi:hypothetical protein
LFVVLDVVPELAPDSDLLESLVFVDVDDAPHLVVGDVGIPLSARFPVLFVTLANGVRDQLRGIPTETDHLAISDVDRKGAKVVANSLKVLDLGYFALAYDENAFLRLSPTDDSI